MIKVFWWQERSELYDGGRQFYYVHSEGYVNAGMGDKMEIQNLIEDGYSEISARTAARLGFPS